MSDNYPSDVKLDENPDGSVSFATGVVETIAGLAAQEVEGVASMASASTALPICFPANPAAISPRACAWISTAAPWLWMLPSSSNTALPVPDVAKSIQENVKRP